MPGNLHQPIQDQHQKLRQKLKGHYAYYGITGNSDRLSAFLRGVRRTWKHWLSRRDRGGPMSWAEYQRLERRYSLPPARVVQMLTWTTQRIRGVRNRMLEICTSGSVGGLGG